MSIFRRSVETHENFRKVQCGRTQSSCIFTNFQKMFHFKNKRKFSRLKEKYNLRKIVEKLSILGFYGTSKKNFPVHHLILLKTVLKVFFEKKIRKLQNFIKILRKFNINILGYSL